MSPSEPGDGIRHPADEPVPWWDYRERASRAGAGWAESHPGGAAALLYLLAIGGGVLAIWWAAANLLAHPGERWLPAALIGALLAAAGTGFWAYVAVVRNYQVGRIGKALSYVYIYGAAGAGLFAFFTKDDVSAWSVFASTLVGVSMLLSIPLVVVGRRRYSRDPIGARRIMARATWLPMNPLADQREAPEPPDV